MDWSILSTKVSDFVGSFYALKQVFQTNVLDVLSKSFFLEVKDVGILKQAQQGLIRLLNGLVHTVDKVSDFVGSFYARFLGTLP